MEPQELHEKAQQIRAEAQAAFNGIEALADKALAFWRANPGTETRALSQAYEQALLAMDNALRAAKALEKKAGDAVEAEARAAA
jgi:hypothetical protein